MAAWLKRRGSCPKCSQRILTEHIAGVAPAHPKWPTYVLQLINQFRLMEDPGVYAAVDKRIAIKFQGMSPDELAHIRRRGRFSVFRIADDERWMGFYCVHELIVENHHVGTSVDIRHHLYFFSAEISLLIVYMLLCLYVGIAAGAFAHMDALHARASAYNGTCKYVV